MIKIIRQSEPYRNTVINYRCKVLSENGISSLCLTGVALFAGDKIPAKRLPVSDGFKFPEIQQEMDVYEVGRFDFDHDGTPEQIVITSGGGSGGAI